MLSSVIQDWFYTFTGLLYTHIWCKTKRLQLSTGYARQSKEIEQQAFTGLYLS